MIPGGWSGRVSGFPDEASRGGDKIRIDLVAGPSRVPAVRWWPASLGSLANEVSTLYGLKTESAPITQVPGPTVSEKPEPIVTGLRKVPMGAGVGVGVGSFRFN